MKIKDGFVLREVMGQAVVVPTGEATKVFSGMIKLNDTGKFVWEGLAKGLDEPSIVKGMIEEFDVTEEQATEGVKNFIDKMSKKGFIE